jgi:multidrug efflux pump subunit AcrB
MRIVRFALRFPYLCSVLAALIVLIGYASFHTMPIDILPEMRIPVVTVIWQYTGLSASELERRITAYSQPLMGANVNGIRNMETQSLNGVSIQRIYFQRDVSLDLAITQVVSATNSVLALMSPGLQAPVVLQFNADSVAVPPLSLGADPLNEQQPHDYTKDGRRRVLLRLASLVLLTAALAADAWRTAGPNREVMDSDSRSKTIPNHHSVAARR